jgi:membrane-associated phospholipid phosphatase
MARLRPYLWAFLTCAVLVLLAQAFVDRPAARFAHDDIGGSPVLFTMQRIPEWFSTAAVPVVVIGALVQIARGSLPFAARTAFLASVSLLLATAIKDSLKFAFGHTWPETWTNHNPSYIQDGVYGYFPFHGGAGWSSFPSGHMTVITAVCGILWLAWPRLRTIWVLPPLVTAVGLYGMDYHFVADMIGGSFLGSGVAVATWQLSAAAPAIQAPTPQALYGSFSPGTGQSIATSSPAPDSVR